MIADTPQALMIALAATTLLGAVMGYCLALIRAKRAARNTIEAARSEFAREHTATRNDLQSSQSSVEKLQGTLLEANNRATAALKREEALEVHSQLQAQRIQTLESQVSSYEDQQIRLQRDFASYKTNKSRELEMARSKPGSWSETDQLPVLSKRIGESESGTQDVDNRDGNVAGVASSTSQKHFSKTTRQRAGLSIPLSRELDIPSLSESELPDSVDELEFEMADLDGTGGWTRG